ncbi:serine O-acetyltransferase [Microbacterium sp. JZ31]|uniref:serine O-acetyltransferase n=1 Tax=Microbacterium sp. JZ31 TaxID=1906274 RepID=UPI001932DD9A|nr:serine acetyltransferase [Microbacterium sp. JZ31]
MGAFAVDRAKAYAVMFGGARPGRSARAGLWLTRPELPAVAAYRFGQWAERLRERRRMPGALCVLLHRVWNTWLMRIDHIDINHGARIGPGLLLVHGHGVIIGPVRIGANSVLHQNVTIGQRVARGDQGMPTIGDDVWIGPGATITGAITIGDRATISAGTVLSRDVPAGALVAGNPGRVVARDYDNGNMINFVVPADPPLTRAG